MIRILSIIVFFGIAIGVAALMHYYVWARLIRDPSWPWPWSRRLTIMLVVVAASMPLSMLVGRFLPVSLARLSGWPVFTWMGVSFFLLLALAVADVARLAMRPIVELGPALADPGRRAFVARAFAGFASLATVGVSAWGLRRALAAPDLRELSIELSRLPPALSGTTIVQITDVHIGSTIGREFVEMVVTRTNALSPDLIAITGDLVDGSVEQLRDAVAPLALLRARYGVFFVTGNHEYYSGIEPWLAELERLGIRVLRNERVRIGSGEHGFDLAGVDDFTAHQFGDGHGADLARALEGRDPATELVLLAHQPRAFPEARTHGVGLQLSGHTHGGQLWPWSYAVRLQSPYVVGLFQEGPHQLYVSPGTGYWGPPMRVGTRAEITRVVLTSPVVSA